MKKFVATFRSVHGEETFRETVRFEARTWEDAEDELSGYAADIDHVASVDVEMEGSPVRRRYDIDVEPDPSSRRHVLVYLERRQ